MRLNILMVGNYTVNFHEEAFAKEFERRGHNVKRFRVNTFLGEELNSDTPIKFYNCKQVYYRVQNRLQFGPSITRLNKDIKVTVDSECFDFVFFYRPVLFTPQTIAYIASKTRCFAYNNDDPFSTKASPRYWHKYIKSLYYYHHIFSYRMKNMLDYTNLGMKNVSILRSYYIKESNYSITPKTYNNDIVFIGHFEDDGRDKVFMNLLENGINLRIYGPDWNKSIYYSSLCQKLGYEITPLRGLLYNDTINRSKIALVLFSKINNDGYTRRCFEIPATNTLMLSERTKDMLEMFSEDVDAVYFSTEAELVTKINQYLRDDSARIKIAQNGYNRLIEDGHEICDRVNHIIQVFMNLKSNDKIIMEN